MANRIRRGPGSTKAETINLPVVGAYLPGTVVIENAAGTQLTQATGPRARLLVLGNREFADQIVTEAYTASETGVAYRPRPDEEFQMAFAAASYTRNQELTVNASGQLAAAGSGDPVWAFFDEADATLTANQLADVVWATGYANA